MEPQLLTIDRRWVQQELVPYLRCAFSHVLPYGTDFSALIQNAVQFCLNKPHYPTDGDDLIFERICQAIQFRDKDFAPDLSLVTENPEPLAKFLIRRAQLKGPYDLQGRTNVASGVWREYEKSKLEKMSHAVEDEDKVNTAVNPPPPSKPAPTDDQIDPRLINAQPGQFVLPQVPEMLSYADDHYYRRQNQSWDEHRRHVSRTPSWQQQLQHAATTTPHPSVQVPGRGWSYGQPPIGKPQAPSYVQDLGQRHGAFAVQAPTGAAGASYNATMGPPLSRVASFHSPYHPSVPQARAYPADGSYVGGQLQHHISLAYREVPTQQQLMQMPPSDHGINYGPVITTPSRSPAANAASSTPTYASGSAAIPTADIAHLRGNEWAEMAQQRARAFSMLSQHEKAQRLLQMQQPQAAQGPFQPNPLQPQLQQGLMQPQNADPTQRFSNHPGFSNVRSAFPNTQFIAGMNPHQAPAQKDDVGMTELPFGTDLQWR